MAILRDVLTPVVQPQQVIAPSRRPRMNQAEFYTQQLQQSQSQPQLQQSNIQQYLQQSSPPVGQQDSTQQFDQQPLTGDYIKQQLASYANRTPPPQLDPSARVVSPNMALVDPSNFQAYYQQLGTIDEMGQSMEQTAQAKAAYKRQQDLNNILSQQVQAFKGASLQGGSGGSAYGNPIPQNPKENFKFAQQIAPNYGWNAQELQAWYTLGMKESGWNNIAQNPTSTAFGIGQFLNSTWAGVGIPKTSDPRLQVEAMARYIKNRYGSPSKALAFHLAHNWY